MHTCSDRARSAFVRLSSFTEWKLTECDRSLLPLSLTLSLFVSSALTLLSLSLCRALTLSCFVTLSESLTVVDYHRDHHHYMMITHPSRSKFPLPLAASASSVALRSLSQLSTNLSESLTPHTVSHTHTHHHTHTLSQANWARCRLRRSLSRTCVCSVCKTSLRLEIGQIYQGTM